ncbi:hypothetical protein AAG570_003409, partial [Ranatra chinensis]
VYWGSVVVLVPAHWGDRCVGNTVVSQGEVPNVRVGPTHPVYKDSVWTQQSRPCGHQGDYVYIGYKALMENIDLGRSLVREWAKYRYGVFDEVGYEEDLVYPACYFSDLSEDVQVNGCSDKPISENGGRQAFNISSLVHPEAHTSLLFSDSHQIDKFCDVTSHDRFAPTKHNNLCQRKSVMQVIHQHPDFINGTARNNDQVITTPTIVYKKEILTRYVVVIEDTKDMNIRESWTYLRLAIRKWIVVQLQGQVEVALVAANESTATLLQRLTPLRSSDTRDLLASNLPYNPGDSRAACLACGVNLAYQLLQEGSQKYGPANSVLVLIAPGTNDHTPELSELVLKLKKAHIRIATITYPAMSRSRSLDWLAETTDGIAFTVMEAKYNMATSYISTYFKLTNVMSAIQQKFYQGDKLDLPIEIHRKEIIDNGQNSVVGSFVLDSWLGEPAKFTVLSHNTENPLIRSISLVSPSHRVFSTRSDALSSLKLLTIPANINETGTWTYTIERFPGSPQPHYVQVMATPRSNYAPVVTAKLYTAQTPDYLILYTDVKKGDYPVLGAKVEVSVTKQGVNGSIHRERFELLDTGSGDPDLMKGDGVYSRYFSAHMGGSGAYTFEVAASDNGNTAYTWQSGHKFEEDVITSVSCCGSVMPAPSVEQLSPFQRILPPITLHLTTTELTLGRVADLRAVILAADLKARLIWTAPDMGGKSVGRYEVRYASGIGDILDSFESGTVWAYASPFPLAPGSETTFTIDFTRDPSLLDQTLYFAIRAFTDLSEYALPGPVSNWVRITVPSPPPPPPVITSTPTTIPIWPQPEESVVPNMPENFEINLEIILPLAGGILLLLILIITLYCYFCFRKKEKKETKTKHPEKPLNVSIVPTENGNNVNTTTATTPVMTSPQSYTEEIRVEDDAQKQRYSVSNYDTMTIPQTGGNMSILGGYGNGTLTVLNEYDTRSTDNNTISRDKTLSPYQSWTASQLLHEHERRHSPYGQAEDYSQYYSPPVPPLPVYQQDIYDARLPPPNQFMNYQPNPTMYNTSLQGSMSSVNSAERKRRNVTMV